VKRWGWAVSRLGNDNIYPCSYYWFVCAYSSCHYYFLDAGLLGAVYFATFMISNIVTNNAAAALLFPIALDAAEQTGTDRIIMSYSLMLGASASFMSPFGYT
jgi:di/tricarboxylate transporter